MAKLSDTTPTEPLSFSRPQVCQILGITDGKLKGILDRHLVRLENHNPGHGFYRQFSYYDIVKVAVAVSMARVGVPMREMDSVADFVANRARMLEEALKFSPAVFFNPVALDALVARLQQLGPEGVRSDLPEGFGMGLWLALAPPEEPEGRWTWSTVDGEGKAKSGPPPLAYAALHVDRIIADTILRIVRYAAQPKAAG